MYFASQAFGADDVHVAGGYFLMAMVFENSGQLDNAGEKVGVFVDSFTFFFFFFFFLFPRQQRRVLIVFFTRICLIFTHSK